MDKSLFNGLKAYSDIYDGLKAHKDKPHKEEYQICGTADTGRVHMMSALTDGFKYKIVVAYDEKKARELYEDMKYFEDNVFYYPPKDFIFYGADMESGTIAAERLKVFDAVSEDKCMTVITTIESLMEKIPPKEAAVLADVPEISAGSVVQIEALRHMLVKMGYRFVHQVNAAGEFSIRGGIIDIYTMTDDMPFRIELWDDSVDSIRIFDPDSQRAVDHADCVRISPASAYILTNDEIESGIDRIEKELEKHAAGLRKCGKTGEAHRIEMQTRDFIERLNCGQTDVPLAGYINYFYENTAVLTDYFDRDKMVILFDETVRVTDRMKAVEYEFKESMINRLEKGYVLPEQVNVIYSSKETIANLERCMMIHFTVLEQKLKDFNVNAANIRTVSMKNINPYNGAWNMLVSDLNVKRRKKYKTFILSGSVTRARRLAAALCTDYGMSAYYSEDAGMEIPGGGIMVLCGNIHKGYEYADAGFVVINDTDIFGRAVTKKKKRKYTGQRIGDFAALKAGDYVVHENHGLGIYRGIEKIEVEKTTKDYIKVEYAKGGNLYIPATQLDMLQKYSGGSQTEGSSGPKLNTLGSKEWSVTKQKVRKAVRDMAAELVSLYAKRQAEKGYAYGRDTIWQKEFEEMFQYEETEDQTAAIEDTKRDMESDKIMDRLICGDVGYGKTEIAIRAAFKAVQEGKQVVYLVPTTILAQQHYNTFRQRMKDFPVEIEMMSRFRTKKQLEKTAEGLRKGYVDIVIGTHRVLSGDVRYKDLGLLIIDEEQRFGVAHKEKIKKLKNNVDVLTLTATPIPRTLHMSLVGIRDMSVLEEAPVDRVPIQTYVMEYDEEMVREAINRELSRGGQVYYVYNKVKNIEEITSRVASLVPDAVVTYAHGQMSERKLENIMIDFINGDIDVLVSTTIIETGLDISNVNTMIIHDSDRMGLSQLYQLRGRIGRSNRTSYAFLMYRRDKMLHEIAEKRLHAIKEFTELGSGFKIAMRDLELRGAGNVLGAEQHGHMEAVGYDLYCKMLNREVNALKGGESNGGHDGMSQNYAGQNDHGQNKQHHLELEDFDTAIDIDVDAYIPREYIPNELQKLNIYRKIASIENEREYDDMIDELIDRYGEIPKAADNLLKAALLKARAHSLYISDISGNIKGDAKKIKIVMYEKADINIEKLPQLLKEYCGRLVFTGDKNPYFTLRLKTKTGNFREFTEEMSEFFSKLENIKNRNGD